jgi:glutamate-1-semialdehyde 2,1-aminomutase
MPFRKFFGSGKEEKPKVAEQDPGDETVEPEADAEPESDAELDVPPEHSDEIDWRRRAAAVIPMGTSTGSKRAAALYGADDAIGPTHFTASVGCRLFDTDGNEYIDCGMALGAVALGYAEPAVTRAVIEAAGNGNVSLLSDVREIEVAERLCDVIPCAEMVQFLKTGAEATSAAVRIARVYTGREMVIGCGYFGWHDWSSAADGVPHSTRSSFRSIPFDDVPALDAAVADLGTTLAAIVIEPVVEKLPTPQWIARARELCDQMGAVLIFDEIKTGFRLATGGYQAYAKVTPDLASFGKALANGYPLSAVVGKRPLMEAARKTWISSTLASESTGLAAASAVLDWHERADICESLASIGLEQRESLTAAIKASGITGVSVEGIDQMWFLRFDAPERERRFLELATGEGVLFKRGAYNYPALAHDEEALRLIESGASDALVNLRDEEAQA